MKLTLLFSKFQRLIHFVHLCFFVIRKHCCNCHCGKIEHDVIEDVDPGFYFVGRIFDLPLRSKKEELTFCYGSNSSSDEDEEGGSRQMVDRKRSNNNNNDTIRGITKTSSTPGVKKSNKKNVKFDWIPPNVSENLVNNQITFFNNLDQYYGFKVISHLDTKFIELVFVI